MPLLVAHRTGEPEPTGIGRYVAELVPALRRRTALTLAVPHEADERRPTWAPSDLPLRRVPGPRGALLATWSAVRHPRIERLVHTRPGIVHVLHAFTVVPTAAPLVVTVHDLAPRHHPGAHGRKERWLFERAAAQAVDRAAAIVTVSQHVARQVVDELGADPRRVHAILSGAPGRRPAPAAHVVAAARRRHGLDGVPYVVALGADGPRKDRATAVAAVGRVPGLVLAVIGPLGAVGSSSDPAHVRRTGFVPDADVHALLAGAVALVHPSLDEGFGFPPVEAMAQGVPALTSDGGALPEVVGDGGLVLPVGDVDRWAEALLQVLEDADLRADLVRRGTERVGALRWDDTAAALVALYASLTG